MTYSTNTQQGLFAPFVDEQAVAQAELESHIEAQSQVVAPAGITVVEISVYDQEIYVGKTLIASITYDSDDFVTQGWVVIINGLEVHRANTWVKCHDYISYHYKQGTLPVQEAQVPATSTDNEVMVEIAAACDEFGFEILNDGIYQNDQKLGEVGCTDGRWWLIRASDEHQRQVPCDSARSAVWSLSMVEASINKYAGTSFVSDEELLDKPFEELTACQWERLREYKPSRESKELIAA